MLINMDIAKSICVKIMEGLFLTNLNSPNECKDNEFRIVNKYRMITYCIIVKGNLGDCTTTTLTGASDATTNHLLDGLTLVQMARAPQF